METAAIRHALRGKVNSMQLSVALLPAVEPDEVLVYLEHIRKQSERIVELIDELEQKFDRQGVERAQRDQGDPTRVPGALLEPSYNPQAPPPPTA